MIKGFEHKRNIHTMSMYASVDDCEQAILADPTWTPLQKLAALFKCNDNDVKIRAMDVNLFYAILGAIDGHRDVIQDVKPDTEEV